MKKLDRLHVTYRDEIGSVNVPYSIHRIRVVLDKFLGFLEVFDRINDHTALGIGELPLRRVSAHLRPFRIMSVSIG